jgi:hypothetical protein
MRRIQREIGSANLPYRDKGCQQFGQAIEINGNQRARFDPLAPQTMSDPRCRLLDLAIRQPPLAMNHGYGVWPCPHLTFD